MSVKKFTLMILRESPERSFPGIAIAALSLAVMPLLARAKRSVAAGIGSGAKEDVRLIVMVALFCTLRISEVLGLKWKHVRLTHGVLEVRERYYRGDSLRNGTFL